MQSLLDPGVEPNAPDSHKAETKINSTTTLSNTSAE